MHIVFFLHEMQRFFLRCFLTSQLCLGWNGGIVPGRSLWNWCGLQCTAPLPLFGRDAGPRALFFEGCEHCSAVKVFGLQFLEGLCALQLHGVYFSYSYILASGGCTTVIGCRPDDVLYSPLPLYHSVAGMIALAGTMKHGITMVMRNKFSASQYWVDCVKYRVTVSPPYCCLSNNNLFASILKKSSLFCDR